MRWKSSASRPSRSLAATNLVVPALLTRTSARPKRASTAAGEPAAIGVGGDVGADDERIGAELAAFLGDRLGRRARRANS